MIKGVIFDMDGTLLDSMPFWRTCSSDFLRAKGLTPEEGLDEKMATMSIDEGGVYLQQRYFPNKTADEINREVSDHLIDAYAHTIVAKSGAVEALRGLKARGIKVALATASERCHSDPAFERLGVMDCFDGLYTCGQAGRGKSHPDVFLLAAREMGLSPAECAVVEDAPHALRTAKAAGFVTVAVPDESMDWAEAQTYADHTLSSLTDWEEMLAW